MAPNEKTHLRRAILEFIRQSNRDYSKFIWDICPKDDYGLTTVEAMDDVVMVQSIADKKETKGFQFFYDEFVKQADDEGSSVTPEMVESLQGLKGLLERIYISRTHQFGHLFHSEFTRRVGKNLHNTDFAKLRENREKYEAFMSEKNMPLAWREIIDRMDLGLDLENIPVMPIVGTVDEEEQEEQAEPVHDTELSGKVDAILGALNKLKEKPYLTKDDLETLSRSYEGISEKLESLSGNLKSDEILEILKQLKKRPNLGKEVIARLNEWQKGIYKKIDELSGNLNSDEILKILNNLKDRPYLTKEYMRTLGESQKGIYEKLDEISEKLGSIAGKQPDYQADQAQEAGKKEDKGSADVFEEGAESIDALFDDSGTGTLEQDVSEPETDEQEIELDGELSKDETPVEIYERAKQARKDSKYEESMSLLQSIEDDFERKDLLYCEIGCVHGLMGDYSDSIGAYDKLLAGDVEYDDSDKAVIPWVEDVSDDVKKVIEHNVGYLLEQRGNYEDAEKFAKANPEENPNIELVCIQQDSEDLFKEF